MGLFSGITDACSRSFSTASHQVNKVIDKTIIYANRTYSIEGFEKFSKVIKALGDFTFKFGMTNRFQVMTKVANAQKELLYATMGPGGTVRFISDMTVENFLNMTAAWFDFAKFLQKNEVFELKTFSQIGNVLGNFKIFGIQPFTFRPFSNPNPKDTPVFFSSIVSITKSVGNLTIFGFDHRLRKFLENSENKAYKDIVQKIFVGQKKVDGKWVYKTPEDEKTWENFWKQLGNAGKIGLIWNGEKYYRTRLFACGDLLTQTAGYFALLAKNK